MKNIRAFFIGVFFAVLTTSCYLFNGSTMTFVNDSDIHVDSIQVSVNRTLTQTVKEIESKSEKTFSIDLTKVKLNSHDITVNLQIFSGGENVSFADEYNDLRGAPAIEYKVVFTKPGQRSLFISADPGY